VSDLSVVDQFFDTFNRYIDSGFGLVHGEVSFLSATLVAIDVTLAALMWSWSTGEDILARLVRKTLYVGFFAFIIGNFQRLAGIVLTSFAGLGLKASGAGLSADDLLRPGKLALTGFSAAMPFLEAASDLTGFPAFFENMVQAVVLLVGWILVLLAFFIMAVQLFVTLIEFKLVTLAGFVLVPFGLFGKTAFLAERVLGGVAATGVKVLVLAVIVGIGSTLFETFQQQAGGEAPTLVEVAAMVLAALVLLGLSIFSPSVAAGLLSGAPQLGAGAAVGTGLVAGGVAMAGAGLASIALGGSASAAAAAGGGAAGGGLGGGPAGGAPSGGPTPPQPGGSSPSGAAPQPSPKPRTDNRDPGDGGGQPSGGAEPDWARDLKTKQAVAHGVSLAAHATAAGDNHGGGAAPKISED